TNVAHVDNYDADYFINYYVVSNLAVLAASVVNQSFTYGMLSVSDQQAADSAFDDYAATYGKLFVSGACNADISLYVCAPGTAYNSISVGAYQVNVGLANSSIGPTPDNGRCKPDITAPAGATSYSTPQVSGAAAVLMQAALRGDGGGDTNSASDSRTLKALLLNGAVKPVDWTNANSSPLDARYGAGVVNVLNSYEQLIAGKHGLSISTNLSPGAAHPPLVLTNPVSILRGWDFTTNATTATSDQVGHYFFNVTNAAGGGVFSATITLVWNRQAGETNINDLDLFLFNAASSNHVVWSTSRVDNVEHIFVHRLPAGRYDVEVLKNGGTNVASNAETYALA
ncbi:MAG: S8 family serine peptidase, partial [Verrucomicrobia bacterium]|nr:S8 family serine peptidase [Verrucomicrobiota bacterium]